MPSRFDPQRLLPESYPGPGLDIPVLYGDLDTNRHLNNVAVGRFFEQGRFMLLRSAQLARQVRRDGGNTLVARVAVDYLSEGRLGVLHVRTRLARLGTSSATLEQAAWQEDRCVALAETVFVHVRDGAAAPWADDARDLLAALV